VGLGRLDNGQLQVRKQTVVVANEREIHLDALLDGRIRKSFGHAVPVGL
jgi:hypothetical protein